MLPKDGLKYTEKRCKMKPASGEEAVKGDGIDITPSSKTNRFKAAV